MMVVGEAIYSLGASLHDLTLIPLNIITVGVDKIGEVARIATTVRNLNCESPHVTHIPHLRLLLGFWVALMTSVSF